MERVGVALAYVGKKLIYSAIHPTSLITLGVAYTYGGIPYIGAWVAYSVIYY